MSIWSTPYPNLHYWLKSSIFTFGCLFEKPNGHSKIWMAIWKAQYLDLNVYLKSPIAQYPNLNVHLRNSISKFECLFEKLNGLFDLFDEFIKCARPMHHVVTCAYVYRCVALFFFAHDQDVVILSQLVLSVCTCICMYVCGPRYSHTALCMCMYMYVRGSFVVVLSQLVLSVCTCVCIYVSMNLD